MKRLSAFLLIALWLLSTAVAEEVVFPTFEWERDGLYHWQLDASGATLNKSAHDAGDDWMCSICGSEILDWGDGFYDVTDYDAYGNVLRLSSYDDTNALAYESIHLYTYHEEGVVLKDMEYIDGVLYGENLYTIGAEGEQIPVRSTSWNEDGTTSVNEYDEHGNRIRAVIYTADGAVTFETISEFALDDNGWYYECKTTSRFDSGETFYTETNQYGDLVRTLNTYADGTAWADEAYEHAYEGFSKVWSKQYSFGRLSREESFDDEGNCIQEVEHLEDGGRIVYDYNEHGDVASVTTYAADGSILSTEAVEYDWTE